jgi:hypothetical protein
VAREGQAVQEAPAELEATEVEAVLAVPAVQGEGEVQGAQAAVARAVPVAAGVEAEAAGVEEAAAAVEAEAAAAGVEEAVAVAVAVGVSGS